MAHAEHLVRVQLLEDILLLFEFDILCDLYLPDEISLLLFNSPALLDFPLVFYHESPRIFQILLIKLPL
ncbi:hypothetical protein Mapa_002461 [Marchantia paleacea]|nr:hypothetical protein Mapa_002461 [Marchantia paleacea]